MRPCRCLLVCLSFFTAAGCALDAATGPRAAPEPDRAPSVLVRGPDPMKSHPPPLVIIDGVLQDDPNALATIDPDSIVSIEVLKVTGPAALYPGPRQPGTIIITTRAGASP